MSTTTTLLLVVFSISCCRGVAPVEGSDFRTVSYEALVHNIETFTETGISHFTEILFDVKRYQLIVGARDALFRLSLDGLQKLERLSAQKVKHLWIRLTDKGT